MGRFVDGYSVSAYNYGAKGRLKYAGKTKRDLTREDAIRIGMTMCDKTTYAILTKHISIIGSGMTTSGACIGGTEEPYAYICKRGAKYVMYVWTKDGISTAYDLDATGKRSNKRPIQYNEIKDL